VNNLVNALPAPQIRCTIYRGIMCSECGDSKKLVKIFGKFVQKPVPPPKGMASKLLDSYNWRVIDDQKASLADSVPHWWGAVLRARRRYSSVRLPPQARR
jgi:hypothetical protein